MESARKSVFYKYVVDSFIPEILDAPTVTNIGSVPKYPETSSAHPTTENPFLGFTDEEVAAVNTDINRSTDIEYDEIIGMEKVKRVVKEVYKYPRLFPSYFKGIQSPYRGILLFGPSGMGKTDCQSCCG